VVAGPELAEPPPAQHQAFVLALDHLHGRPVVEDVLAGDLPEVFAGVRLDLGQHQQRVLGLSRAPGEHLSQRVHFGVDLRVAEVAHSFPGRGEGVVGQPPVGGADDIERDQRSEPRHDQVRVGPSIKCPLQPLPVVVVLLGVQPPLLPGPSRQGG